MQPSYQVSLTYHLRALAVKQSEVIANGFTPISVEEWLIEAFQ